MTKKSEQEAMIEKSCAFCELGTLIVLSSEETTDVICEKHGIVPKDHICRSFRYDLLKREPQEKSLSEIAVASKQG
ncbi:MAG: hypothetical protein IKD07_05965 [Clostridia bacterium]|nr:hypothetical protein [Clostridia bacterium]